MKNILGLLVGIIFSLSVFGWGQTGHRVIGEIAQHHLSKKAKKALHEIMGHESLVEASTWMDEIKSDSAYDHTHSWHYVTVPDGDTYSTSEKNKKGDAYETILRMRDIVKSETATKAEKRDAIRMLVHIIGDVHQPLHVGNGEDRGGNSVKIKWFYDNSNLHRIWDSEMIDSKGFSYSELAKLIDHSDQITVSKLSTTKLDVWVKEAQELRPQIYAFPKDKEYLSYEYSYKNWDTVKDQLLKGGIRLAQLLNEVFEN